MKVRIPVEPIVAAVALAVALFAVVWWLASAEEVAAPSRPTYRGDAVKVLTAALPAIGDFDRDYNVNDENPFVPYDKRVLESKQIKINRTAKPTPTSKPPQVEEVHVPELKFPAAASRRADAPDCIGVVASGAGEVLLVRMPGSDETISVAAGEPVPKDAPADRQWTLVALEPGGVARFRDPSGAEQLFMIGALPTITSHDAPVVQSSSPQPPQPPPQTPKPHPQPQPVPPPQRPHGNQKPPGQGGQPGEHPRGWTPRPPSEIPPPAPPMPAR
jgi:hypothetical protein